MIAIHGLCEPCHPEEHSVIGITVLHLSPPRLAKGHCSIIRPDMNVTKHIKVSDFEYAIYMLGRLLL